jgi:hypothetical protein
MKALFLLIIVGIAFISLSCGAVGDDTEGTSIPGVVGIKAIKVTDYDVTCFYTYQSGINEGGPAMSCLPNSVLK